MKRLGIFVMPLMAISFLMSCNKGGGDNPPEPPEPGPSSETPMYFKCLSDTASLFAAETLDVSFSLECSNDAKTWKPVEFKEMGGKVCIFSLKKDETLYFRGDNTFGFNGDLSFLVQEKDGDLSVNGNIMSLIQKTDFSTMTAMPKNCFKDFFIAFDNVFITSDE